MHSVRNREELKWIFFINNIDLFKDDVIYRQNYIPPPPLIPNLLSSYPPPPTFPHCKLLKKLKVIIKFYPGFEWVGF